VYITSSWSENAYYYWYYGKDGAVDKHTAWGDGYQVSMYAANIVLAPAFIANSDSRLKKNIRDIRTDVALDAILKIRPVSFAWKDDMVNTGIKTGVLAQDLERILPDCVKKTKAFIPDIYCGIELIYSIDVCSFKCKFTHDKSSYPAMIAGDVLKVCTQDKELHVTVKRDVVYLADGSFVLCLTEPPDSCFTKNNEIFIYGKEVDDCRSVDYDGLFVYLIPVIQQQHYTHIRTAELLNSALARIAKLEECMKASGNGTT
jgi:hypothetical protein